MTLSQAYCDKYEAQLRQWKAQLDRLRALADQARAEAKIELYSELHDLQSRYDGVSEKLSRAKTSTSDAWDEMRFGFEKSWNELKRAFDRAAARLR